MQKLPDFAYCVLVTQRKRETGNVNEREKDYIRHITPGKHTSVIQSPSLSILRYIGHTPIIQIPQDPKTTIRSEISRRRGRPSWKWSTWVTTQLGAGMATGMMGRRGPTVVLGPPSMCARKHWPFPLLRLTLPLP